MSSTSVIDDISPMNHHAIVAGGELVGVWEYDPRRHAARIAFCRKSRNAWWAPLVLGGAWLATHWLLRESPVWRDRNTDEVRSAQRHAHYAYRLAVDPPASKELRLFGLVGWTIERFVATLTRLHQLQLP